MAKKRIVMAIGHKDMGTNLPEQKEAVQRTAKVIADFIQEGWQVAIVHSNAPQVGMIHTAMNEFGRQHDGYSSAPMSVCSAMSQGYIGYHLQQAIQRELARRGIDKECASVVTQMVVSKDDPAFQKPTKPVGSFYSKEDADKIVAEKGYTFVEDAGRGWRRVVPSPLPTRIVELKVVEQLVAAGDVVITVGGGGIPVVETADGLCGVAAVIDKDRSSSKLALDIDADMLVILTAVDRVCINFNKPNQKELAEMNVEEAKQYIAEGHFAPGSMLPKVEACLDFVQNNKSGGTALITSLKRAKEALSGATGTIIRK